MEVFLYTRIKGKKRMNKFNGKSSKYFNALINTINNIKHDEIDNAISLISEKHLNGKQIIVIGNGGSSLNALHYINDWNKSIFLKTKIRFLGRTLIDNLGLAFSYANDVSFEDVFVEQLKNILAPGDLLIALSGSGNSKNVLKAVEFANSNNADTLSLCGFDGGELKKISKHCIWVNKNDMQLTEDIHFIFGHIVMQSLCNDL